MKYFILFALILISSLSAQDNTFLAASWNVENFYDTTDDPAVDDAEFLPSSDKKWDSDKYQLKIKNLASVIMSMNEGKGPDLLGLVEVENQSVLEDLVKQLNAGYAIVHRESPDGRGIDNALLYREKMFTVLNVKSDTVNLDQNEKTRSILETNLKLKNGGVVTVFVNHWPSRRGGELSEPKRMKAALTLKNRLKDLNGHGFDIIMGDFNDEPENKSIDSVLNAGPPPKELVNLAYSLSINGQGTYRYRDEWNMLDQIIICDKSDKLDYVKDSFQIYKPDFMTTQSGSYKGVARPTFAGNKYLAGYSDHFPVTARFVLTNGK